MSEAYWYRKNTLGLNRYVDAIGARRRLQALAVLGWGTKALAAHTGVTHAHLQQVRSGAYKTVMQDTHHAIDRAYRALMWTRNMTRGAAGTSAHARRMQWIPPAGWDDIDNKKERPKGLSDE